MRTGKTRWVLAYLVLTAALAPCQLASIPEDDDPVAVCTAGSTSGCRAGQHLLQVQAGAEPFDANFFGATLSSGSLAEKKGSSPAFQSETRWLRKPIANASKVEGFRLKDAAAHNLIIRPKFSKFARLSALLCMAFCAIMIIVALQHDYQKQHKKWGRSLSSATAFGSALSLASEGADDSASTFSALPELHDLKRLAESGGILPLIENWAEKRPNHLAVIDNADGSKMTYYELLAAVQCLARQLQEAGVGDGDIIALLLKPSKMLMITALGVMHTGAAWLPLDADAPAARLQQLLELAGARLGIGLPGLKALDSITEPPIWCLGAGCVLSTGPHSTLPGSPTSPSTASCPARSGRAVIFFTSGSTGTPKGVVYGHETLLHGVSSMAWLCSMNTKTVSLLKTPIHWAVIEYEMFPALIAGGRVVCDAQCQTDSRGLSKVLLHQRITVLMTSGQVLRLLMQGAWKGTPELPPAIPASLCHVVNVGGPLNLDICAEVTGVMPYVQVHNLYGCTESACTQWTYVPGMPSSAGMRTAPAGRPQHGCDVYVVDQKLRPVPEGEEGEICFGGPYLAHDYLGDPRLTEARFVREAHNGERLYRTGDLGRLIEDPASNGLVLEVIGRADRQLNLHGIRVAPEEIEVVLFQVPGVQEAAVVASNNSIVAYIQGKDPALWVVVRERCGQKLAANMRPVLIRQLMSMPLLRNGKVDLAALTRRAAEDLKLEMVEAVDSLGMMQRISKDQVAELDTLAAARGLAIAANLLWHWYWLFPAGEAGPSWQGPSESAFDNSIPSIWSQYLLTGFLGYEWTTQVFIMASAYTERKSADQCRSIYPRQELLIFVLYLALWWPSPDLFAAICNGLGNTHIKPSLEVLLDFRWYLMVYLMCRLLHRFILAPLEESLKSVPAITALVCRAFFAGSWWLLALAYCEWNINLCPGLDPSGYAFKTWELFWPLTRKPKGAETYCAAIFHPWVLSSLALYISAWFYGQSLVAWVRTAPWLRRIGPLPLPWTAGFIALLLLLGQPAVIGFLRQKPDIFYWVACFISVWVFMACAQWSDGGWLRMSGLVWAGYASLGTYCFHVYFLCNEYCENPAGPDPPLVVCDRGMFFFSYQNERMIPSPADMMQMLVPFGGFVQLVVLLGYFVFFTLLVGMPLQFACVKIFCFVEQSIAYLFNAWGGNKPSPPIRL